MADVIPVTQTVTLTKTGANWADADEGFVEYDAARTEPSYRTLPVGMGLYTEVRSQVDADTLNIVRSWKDWYDCEDYMNKRSTQFKGLSVQNWAAIGWVISEDIERTE